jgi:osmotically-inducible protein OsmY
MRHARLQLWRSLLNGAFAGRILVAGGVLCLLAGAAVWVAQPVTAEAPTDNGIASVGDIQLTVQARQALEQDATLRPLNLWVTVRGRVATLTGPVPSIELAQLAEQKLRQLPIFVRIVNELRVERAEDAAVNSFTPLARVRPDEAGPSAGAVRIHGSSPRLKPNITVAEVARPVTPTQPDAVFTMPAIRLTVPAQEPTGTSVAKPPMAETADRSVDLLRSIEAIRDSDERFQQIRVEVVNGAVFLRGTLRRGEDQFELAQRISRIPGVSRVVLAEIRVDPR